MCMWCYVQDETMLWREDKKIGKPKILQAGREITRTCLSPLPEIRAIVSEENRGVPNLYVVYVVYMYISRIIIFSSCH